MTKVKRTQVLEGGACLVECAVRQDGQQPADRLFKELKGGIWDDPDQDEFPDSRQSRMYDRLEDLIQQVADGISDLAGLVNYLNDGIWEFKVESLRLTFFDTDGKGNSCTRHCDSVYGWDGKRRHIIPEDFGEILRLGHYFGKLGPKTRPEQLNESSQTREEDFQHDKSLS